MSSPSLLQLAQAAIGAVWVGIPAHCVVQAITLPPTPVLLPRRQGALAAVADHDGRLVPVVDLARWVDMGAAAHAGGAAPGAQVLILHAAGRTIGLKVDMLGALAEVAPGDIARLHHDERDDEVFQCAVRESASGRTLSLLEVERLVRLVDAWHQDAAPAPAPSAGAVQASSEVRLYAVLQAGAARLALAAGTLTEVLPMPQLKLLGAAAGGAADNAYCTWRGRHLPVLSHAALGLEAAPDGAAPPLLAVLERDGLALGLPVHAALNLQAIEASALDPAGGLLSAVFDADGAALRLLDEARLFARFTEAELSRETDAGQRDGGAAGAGAPSGAGRLAGHRATNAGAYIVFEGDGMYAAPIDTLERIVSLRDAATDGNGAMAWEGRPIPLRDLRAGAADTDTGAVAAAGDVMVVRRDGAHVGYVVARVHLLVPPGSGRIYRMGAPGAGWEFIATGDDAAQASYRIVDLGALAA